jgi:hypothetical protein
MFFSVILDIFHDDTGLSEVPGNTSFLIEFPWWLWIGRNISNFKAELKKIFFWGTFHIKNSLFYGLLQFTLFHFIKSYISFAM